MSTAARVGRRCATHSARCTRPSDSREIRCSWLKPGSRWPRTTHDVVAVRDVAQRARRRRVADQREARMGAQQRRGEALPGAPSEHRAQRLGLAGAGDEHQQLAGGEQRAQADRERVGRDVVEAAELLGRVGARPRVQRDDARALLEARSGLVERDVPVVAEAEHGEVDRAPRRGAAGGASHSAAGSARRAVEPVERAERRCRAARARGRRRSCARQPGPRPRYSSSWNTVRFAARAAPACARSAA